VAENTRGRKHEHGNADCVSEYLGSKNSPERTTRRYLDMAKLAPDVQEKIAPPTEKNIEIENSC